MSSPDELCTKRKPRFSRRRLKMAVPLTAVVRYMGAIFMAPGKAALRMMAAAAAATAGAGAGAAESIAVGGRRAESSGRLRAVSTKRAVPFPAGWGAIKESFYQHGSLGRTSPIRSLVTAARGSASRPAPLTPLSQPLSPAPCSGHVCHCPGLETEQWEPGPPADQTSLERTGGQEIRPDPEDRGLQKRDSAQYEVKNENDLFWDF